MGEGEEGRAVVGREPMNERVWRMKRVEKGREAVKGRRERERREREERRVDKEGDEERIEQRNES